MNAAENSVTAEKTLEERLEEQKQCLLLLSKKYTKEAFENDGSSEPSEDVLMRQLVQRCEKKRLFVCCDGTYQNASGASAPLTNVAKLARAVYRIGDDDFKLPDERLWSKLNIFESGSVDMDPNILENNRYGLVRQVVYYSSGVGTQSALPLDRGWSGATGHGNMAMSNCYK